MTKQSGLGDNLYINGYDLSGDVGALSRIGGGPHALEVTGIDKSAHERIGGLRDGGIEFQAWFNDAAAHAHPVLSALPLTDRIVTYCRGTTIGKPAVLQLDAGVMSRMQLAVVFSHGFFDELHVGLAVIVLRTERATELVTGPVHKPRSPLPALLHRLEHSRRSSQDAALNCGVDDNTVVRRALSSAFRAASARRQRSVCSRKPTSWRIVASTSARIITGGRRFLTRDIAMA